MLYRDERLYLSGTFRFQAHFRPSFERKDDGRVFQAC
jgi:hypothetical protein